MAASGRYAVTATVNFAATFWNCMLPRLFTVSSHYKSTQRRTSQGNKSTGRRAKIFQKKAVRKSLLFYWREPFAMFLFLRMRKHRPYFAHLKTSHSIPSPAFVMYGTSCTSILWRTNATQSRHWSALNVRIYYYLILECYSGCARCRRLNFFKVDVREIRGRHGCQL